jgi:hypothetical protein
LAREGSSHQFFDHKPAILVSPSLCWVQIKERHSQHWGASPSRRQSKVFSERPPDELSIDVLTYLGQETVQVGNRIID